MGTNSPYNQQTAETLVHKVETLLHLRLPHLAGGATTAFRALCYEVVFANRPLVATAKTAPTPRSGGANWLAPPGNGQKPETSSSKFAHLLGRTIVGNSRLTSECV